MNSLASALVPMAELHSDDFVVKHIEPGVHKLIALSDGAVSAELVAQVNVVEQNHAIDLSVILANITTIRPCFCWPSDIPTHRMRHS